MKLLSVSIPRHDANLSYFDGQRLHYVKCERTRGIKRFHFEALPDWRAEARALWGREVDDAEDVAFTIDPALLPPALLAQVGPTMLPALAADRSRGERLPPALCDYLGVRRGWLLSHHWCHALSTWMLEPRAPDVHVVIDGIGDSRPWSVYRQGELVAMGDIRNGSIGWGIRDAGKLLGVQAGHYNDIAGKVMGLQAYGRVDAGFLRILAQFPFERLRDIWSVDLWHAYRGDPLVARLGLLDWAATVHHHMGQALVAFFERYASPQDVVSYAGGVAQNVVWNAALQARFPQLVIPPHASDEGLALGGIEWLRRQHGLPPFAWTEFPWAQADEAVPPASPRTIHMAAQVLAQGGVVGWYQGHGEVGPRALGNRSILMDPRLPKGREILNRTKRREPYRPFGASVLQEVTHVDGSCRVQRVGQKPTLLRQLLEQFHRLGGCPVLANTSLNLAGRPIAAHADDARRLLRETPVDAVVIGDELLRR